MRVAPLLLCSMISLAVVACRSGSTHGAESTPVIAPHSSSEGRSSPFSTATSSGRVPTLPQLASVRFQEGIRVGMSIGQLETLAGEKGQVRTMAADREEWTIAWPGEGTGFRVQLREGRVVAWMQAAAIDVEAVGK